MRALLDAAIGQRGQQLAIPDHQRRGTQDVRPAQVDAVLTDGAAVAVFLFAPDMGRAFGKGSVRELDRFFKGKFLLGAVQAASGLIALIIHGAAQIPLAVPAPASYPVLQHHRLHQAFDDLKNSRLIIRDQNFRFHRQFLPCLPPPAVCCKGVLKHLQFHTGYPFPFGILVHVYAAG